MFNIPTNYNNINTLQLINIATNVGNNKNIIEAIITEMEQNSRDANLSSKKENIMFIQVSNNVIAFADNVGIPEKNISSLLIPFLIFKSESKDFIPVGSMGTGFFNVFRQPICEKVLIRTSPPGSGKLLFIEATPVVRKGKVNDIIYESYIMESENIGTEIRVFFKTDINVEAINYINCIACTSDIKIMLNNKYLNVSFQKIYSNKYFEIYFTNSLDKLIYK